MVNHTRFAKEDHLPDWAGRDNKVMKGDRAYMCPSSTELTVRDTGIFHSVWVAVWFAAADQTASHPYRVKNTNVA